MAAKKKLLIIEDENILGEMYQDKFSQSGLEVVLAKSAEEGLEAVCRQKPLLARRNRR